MLKLLLAVISMITAKNVVSGFANGAGACPRGMAAVSGTHLNDPAIPFADSGVKIVLDYALASEIVLEPGGTAEVVDGEDYDIAVVTTWLGPYFKGALIRLDGDGELSSSLLAQTAVACTDAPGITHEDNEEKSYLSGRLAVQGDAVLDVTVVQSNNSTHGSVYTYTQVKLKAIAAFEKPISAPTAPIWAPRTPGAAPVTSASDLPTLLVAAAWTVALTLWSMLLS